MHLHERLRKPRNVFDQRIYACPRVTMLIPNLLAEKGGSRAFISNNHLSPTVVIDMTLYYLKFSIIAEHVSREVCIAHFGNMSADDDKLDLGNVTLLGRWATVGECTGHAIFRADSARDVNDWLQNWSSYIDIEVTPVVDDNVAREIILKSTPEYEVNYDNLGGSAKSGESLYSIEYKFLPEKKIDGYNAFANMSQDEDEKDAGNNTCLGRFHNLGTGSGFAICSSKSEKDIYEWAYNWASICQCVIKPVLDDKDTRMSIKQAKSKVEKKRRCWF